MTWIINNASTIIVGLLLAAAVVAVIKGMIKRKKEGKSSCGCGCDGCSMNNKCHRSG